MLPYSMIAAGTITPAQAAIDISLVSQSPPDFIELRNLGAIATDASTGWGELSDAQEIMWFWQRAMKQGQAKGIRQSSDGANPAMIATFLSSDGISTYDTANPPTFAALASTTINKTTWVISMANTGSIAVGDIVRITDPVAMLQATGIIGQVTAVTANVSITLGYVASAVTAGADFTANATSSNVTKFIQSRFYPRGQQVIHVTQAAQAVVYFAEPNDFTPGELVDFNIPSAWGMIQLSFLSKNSSGPARVLSVTNSSTVSSITLDLDTSGFTAFAYPTSAGSVGKASPPWCMPAGSGVVPDSSNTSLVQQPPGTNLRDAFDNRNTRVIHCGSSMFANGSSSDVWEWRAYKSDQYNQN